MRYEIWKESLAKGGLEPGLNVLKGLQARDLPSASLELIYYIDSAVVSFIASVHLDWQLSRPVSGESSIPKPMVLPQTVPTFSGLSDLSLCFLTCYFVFEFVIVTCYNVFWIVVVFSDFSFFFFFAFAFVICYIVFRIVICFALLGHHTHPKYKQGQKIIAA